MHNYYECGLSNPSLMPRPHQTSRLISALKLLRITLRNRCWPTTFNTLPARDALGWCQNRPLWSAPVSKCMQWLKLFYAHVRWSATTTKPIQWIKDPIVVNLLFNYIRSREMYSTGVSTVDFKHTCFRYPKIYNICEGHLAHVELSELKVGSTPALCWCVYSYGWAGMTA